MKIQKIASVALVCTLMMLGLVSCNNTKGPKEVTKDAVDALLRQDAERFYDYLCTSDKEAVTLDNFKEMLSFSNTLEEASTILPELQNEFKAKDFKETVSGGIATVTFVITAPDETEIGKGAISIKDLTSVIANRKIKSLNDIPEDIKAKIRAHIGKNSIPTVEKIQQFNLVKEGEDWKVKLDVQTFIKAKTAITPFIL